LSLKFRDDTITGLPFYQGKRTNPDPEQPQYCGNRAYTDYGAAARLGADTDSDGTVSSAPHGILRAEEVHAVAVGVADAGIGANFAFVVVEAEAAESRKVLDSDSE
jgi:hypothetical protein